MSNLTLQEIDRAYTRIQSLVIKTPLVVSEAVNIKTIEIHISDIKNREQFRLNSVISDVCVKTISGLGKNSYLNGLKILLNTIK